MFGTKVLCFEGWDWSSQDFEIESLKATFVSYAMNTRAYAECMLLIDTRLWKALM